MEFYVNTESFVFEEFLKNVPMSKIINGQLDGYEANNIFLCPFYALEEQDTGVIIKNSNCKNCGLCDLKYSLLNNSFDSYQTEESIDEILKSIPHISILTNMLFLHTFCAIEVTVDGNSRDKRIDLVLKDSNNLFLFKVLTNSSNLNFYHRSYEEIKEDISETYKDLNVYVIFLVNNYIKNNSKEINDFSFITLEEIVERSRKYGHFIK